MTLLALAVAGYAAALLVAVEMRPPPLADMFVNRPAAIFGHLLGGTIALAAGAFQLNARLRARFLNVHRWTGRVYVLAVLMGGVAGFALALRAFGGVAAQSGFALLAAVWIVSTLNAYRAIRQRNQSAHRVWMMRSYALTLAAVTLRIYLPASQVAGMPIEVAYPAIAWLCWVPNLLIVEWFVRSRPAFAGAPA